MLIYKFQEFLIKKQIFFFLDFFTKIVYFNNMKYTVPTTYQVCNKIGFSLDKKTNEPLEMFTNTGSQSECSDLAKLLGLSAFCDKNQTMNDPYWWIYCPDSNLSCFPNFYKKDLSITSGSIVAIDQKIGLKPFLIPEETAHLLPETAYLEKTQNKKTIQVYTLGQYPQSVADKDTSKTLTEKLAKGELQLTGNNYSFCEEMTYPFDKVHIQQYPEYTFQNNKYICVPSRQDSYSQFDTLSDGSLLKKDEKYWVKVEPLEWHIDKTGHWITKNIILAGVPFHSNKELPDTYEKSYICQYLNSHFKQEFEQTLKNQTLANFKSYLLSELTTQPIPENRMQYMQLLAHTATHYTNTKIPFKENEDEKALKNEILMYIKNLICIFQKNERLTSGESVKQLKKTLHSEKETYIYKLPNRKKVPPERAFLQHFMPFFTRTKE